MACRSPSALGVPAGPEGRPAESQASGLGAEPGRRLHPGEARGSRLAAPPPAGRAEWLRRVTFDLTGLPPSPEEIEAFEADRSPDAYERVVDRLLDSPRYGERWAQHWLDVVRFAETEGYRVRPPHPRRLAIPRLRHRLLSTATSRSTVSSSSRSPATRSRPDDRECLTASIFHRLGPVRRNAGNPEIALSRNEVLTERTDIIGTAFLGLTVGCARCHNHKLEPISQKDYYRLQAYFAATEEHDIVLAPEPERKAWEADERSGSRTRCSSSRQRSSRADGAEKERLKAEESRRSKTGCPPPLPTIPSTRNDFEHRTPSTS